MRFRTLCAGLCAGSLSLSLSLTGSLVAEETVSPWQALPAETVFMLRMADGSAAGDAFGATQFGKMLLDDQRLTQLESLLADTVGAQLGEADAKLEEYGFTREDIKTLFNGDFGIAVVLDAPQPVAAVPEGEAEGEGAADDAEAGDPVVFEDIIDTPEPPLVMLGWTTPGADIVGRVVGLFERIGTEQGEEGVQSKFATEEIGGLSVHHFSRAEQVTQYVWDEEKGEPVEQTTLGDPDHIFMMTEGDRLFLASADHEHLDALKEHLGSFLAKQASGDGGFSTSLSAVPGMMEAQPAGVEVLEMAANLGPVWELAKQYPEFAPAGMDATTFLQMSGLSTLSAGRMVLSLDGGLMRQNIFMAAPKPHVGFMKLLDQPVLDAMPPAWVPASCMQYVALGFDAQQTVETIKELAVMMAGPQAAQGFAMADAQMAQMFGVPDLATLLGGLGDRVSLAYLPADIEEGAQLNLDTMGMKMTRFALVWDLEDADTWSRVVQFGGQMAMGQGMPANIVTREGWIGYDLDFAAAGVPGEVPAMGLYVGHDKLMFTMGDGVADVFLSSIENPAADAGLANSAMAQRSSELLNLEPAWSWTMIDMQVQATSMMTMFDVMVQAAAEDPDMAIMGQVLNLFPRGEELEGALGVSANRTAITEQGILVEAVTELPLVEAE